MPEHDKQVATEASVVMPARIVGFISQIALAETSLGTRSDRDTLRSISSRLDAHRSLRGDPVPGTNSVIDPLPVDTALRWARLDAKEFRQLQDVAEQGQAAQAMAEAARQSPTYATGLELFAPEVAARVADAARSAGTGRGGEAGLATQPSPADRRTREPAKAEGAVAPAEANEANAIEQVARERRLRGEALASATRARPISDNAVEADVVLTARAEVARSAIPPEVERRYRREGDRFYERTPPAAVAFEDKGNRLETRSNSEQIAESMVLVARARGWDEIKVSGSTTFKKEVWLEAAALGMQVRGFTPSEQDKDDLAKRRPPTGRHQTELAVSQPESRPVADRPVRPGSAAPAESLSDVFLRLDAAKGAAAQPALTGAYVLAAVIDRQAEAAGFTPAQRDVIAARARRNIAGAIDRGKLPTVNVREPVEALPEQRRETQRELSR